MRAAVAILCVSLFTGAIYAQEATPEPKETEQQAPERHGKVLFSGDASNMPAPEQTQHSSGLPEPTVNLTDAERDAPVFTAYDLDVHLKPADSQMTVNARIRVRNSGTTPLSKLALQLSSTLRWDGISIEDGGKTQTASFVPQMLDSDVDHTGRVSEAVITLPQALAPGKEVSLTAIYSGLVPVSAERLERIGTPHDTAVGADWDNVGGGNTNLRGFGNVLWYPVASSAALLGDSNRVLRTVNMTKLRQQSATVHMRLTVEYVGEHPNAAYFCGQREELKAISENENVPVAEAPGIATAEWSTRPLGFRTMSLFLTERAPIPAADELLSVVTEREDVVPTYTAAVKQVQPMLADWFGPAQGVLTLIDHPGQPYLDGNMLVAPLGAMTASQMAPLLAHVYFRSSFPWLDQGTPEFAALLWQERSQGRETAVKALAQNASAIALAEPGNPESATGSDVAEALTVAHSEVFYRLKAAAVLWMLRTAAGDDALKRAFKAYREKAPTDGDASGFAHALEVSSGKDLQAFFSDWVYHDKGLPDLSILTVTPSQMKPDANAASSWMIAVNVRNDGDVAADVPVSVRSSKGSTTQNLHVGAHEAGVVRVLFSGVPSEVVVNDGSVPEMATTDHRKEIAAH